TGTPRSLLQATVDRVAELTTPERTHVVTGVTHAAAVARQLPDVPERNLFVEPSPRDSCAAIALAAAVIAVRQPGAVMGAFPADHLVADPDRFVTAVRAAAEVAAAGNLATIGITPTRAETGYGYLHTGTALEHVPGAYRVLRFQEKPSYDVAVEYLKSGHHLWNAGMFLWRVEVFLDELARQRPKLHAGVTRIAAAWDGPAQATVLAEEWPNLEKISVDYAVMEGAAEAGRVATVPGDFGWNDVGDFRTLGDVLPADGAGNVVIGSGETYLSDVEHTVVVPAGGRLVAGLGVRDLVIVDTADAVLVCHRERAQDVKKMVDDLRDRGDTDHV
ncbi:MAG: mannose-1-phosphate guanylyltransferase, partial [Micromonosporaceae bacterium]